MKQDYAQNNPLILSSRLPHQAVDFPSIRIEHYLPALDYHIAETHRRVNAIRDSQEPADFRNTVEALEFAEEGLGRVSRVFFNLLQANVSDELEALVTEIGPKLAAISNDILLDATLFERVQQVYERRDGLDLSAEEEMLLDKTYRTFVRNGALLTSEKKERLRAIDGELSKLGPKFSDNVRKATHAFELVLDSEADLKGLPETIRETARAAANDKGHRDRWLFTLDAPSFVPFMKYADNRELREKMYLAYVTRAFNDGFDNQETLTTVVRLRDERARLLGFSHHADFVLRERMAETTDRVMSFLERLLQFAKPAAERELQELHAFAEKLGGPNRLQPWDVSYYIEKMQEAKFQLSDEELRPYFEINRVVAGVFEHARRLYNLEFVPSEHYPVYHPEVQVFEVYDQTTKDFMGLFYADFHPRPSKSGGAWMTTFHDQGLNHGRMERPHVAIVCNFTKGTPEHAALLTLDEVQTLFHEFGHALHALLSNCRYPSLSGPNVYWDFVELPSQIMENWTLEKEALDLFAVHYKTGKPIPADLAQRIKDASRFMAGYTYLRQLNYAFLDMAWHTTPPDQIHSVPEFEDRITERLRVLPKVTGANISCAFSHIFSGGYSAGYYSYKWAEVLDADAFEYFKEKGLFSPEVARSFRENILSRGGTEHPLVLYRRFRGRDPDADALLRRDGLI